MLQTRLWMGSVLIALVVGILIGDDYLAPWYVFLLVFQVGLSIVGCHEIIGLLGKERNLQGPVCYFGVVLLALANWAVHHPCCPTTPWSALLAILTGFLLVVFLYEMVHFRGPDRCVERMALTWWTIGYLGLLPCFFAQLRWLYAGENANAANSLCLALAVFVPKGCDIGAYFTGKLIGRHRMTPVLSPKKTWEGAIGGLTLSSLIAISIDRLGTVPVLLGQLTWEIAFGVTVGVAGMLGDLAESLIKRDCAKKDASDAVPGFGGVLDVVDAVLFASPVAYLWLLALRPTP